MDLDPSALWDFAGEIVGTVRPTVPAKRATVTRIDAEGTVWVRTPGGKEAPAAECGADVQPGDEVTLGFDGARMIVSGNATSPPASRKTVRAIVAPAQQAADAAARVAKAIRQHFWHDDNGAHISSEAGDAEGAQNALWNSLGMLFRAGADNLLAIVTGSDPGVDVYDGQGNAGSNIIAAFHGSGARIGPEDGTHVSIDSDSMDVMGDDEAVLATFGADETHLGLAGKGAVFLAGDSFELMADSYSSYPPEIDWDDMHALQLGSCRIIPLDEDDDDPRSTVDETYFEILDRGNVVKIVSRRREWYGKEPTEPPWTRGDLPFDRWIAPDTSHVAKVELGTDSNGSSLSLSADVLWANDALVGNPREDGRYGTMNQSAAVSVSNNAEKSIIEVDLEPGTYLLTGHAVFASNATGRRSAGFSPTKDSLTTSYTATVVTVPAADGQVTQIMVPLIYSPQVDTTLYFTVRQTSGAARNVTGQVRWVRLL